MGRAARRRKDPAERVATSAIDQLRKRSKQIRSLEQFALILSQARPQVRDAMRRLMLPLLPMNLPCCSAAKHGLHTPGCQATLEAMKSPAATARFN